MPQISLLSAPVDASLIEYTRQGQTRTLKEVLDDLMATPAPATAPGDLNVKDFGAVDGGDLYASLTSAIARAKELGGGTVVIPPSTQQWTLSAGVTVDADNITIVGAGHGGQHDTGAGLVAATQIVWTGSAGGDMFTISPTALASRRLAGSGIVGVYLYGNNLAGRGVKWRSACEAEIDICGSEFTTALLDMDVLTTLSESADSQHNVISVNGRQLIASAPTLLVGGSAIANVSFNVFRNVTAQYDASPAVVLKSSDNNVFHQIHCVKAGVGTPPAGVILDATDSGVACGNNIFFDVNPGGSGLYAAGTERGANPSILNHIYYYDKGNGVPDPVIGASASLFWSSNLAPIGLRRMVKGASPEYWQESDGRIVVQGKSAAVAGLSSLVIASPIALSVGVTSISVTPNGVGTLFHAAPSGSGIVIYNDGGGVNDFWYRFEGY
jgi:hypothetical protein